MKNKPNVLFLMCDQLQGRVLDAENMCLTPIINKLVSRGIRFTNAYTPNAVCSPARASLMTGLLPHNHGVLHVTHNVDDDQSCLRKDKPHWAQRLKDAGYINGYFGKWHVERSEELNAFGWDVNGSLESVLFQQRRAGLNDGGKDKNKHKSMLQMAKYNEEPPGYNSERLLYGVTEVEPEKRGMGVTTSLALDFLDEVIPGNDPWCCLVSLTEPHDPFVCGADAFALYDVNQLELPPNTHDDLQGRPGLYRKAARAWKTMTDLERKQAMACYYASITEIDGQFGRLIHKLEEAGKLDETIIVLTSDHGELLGAHGLYTKNISAAEEVYSIPLVISGPEIDHGVTSDARVGLHDLCSTLLELTGCQPIHVPDSRSFAAVIMNPHDVHDFTTGFAEYHGGRMLLTQRVLWDGHWKYVFNGFDFDELYDLENDPYEMHNLIDKPEFDEKLRHMSMQMWKIIRETHDHSVYKSDYPSLRLATYGPHL